MKLSPIMKHSLLALLSLALTALIAFFAVIVYLESQLPDIEGLKDAPLQVPLRIYTSDGLLMGEFGAERRNPVALKDVPPQLINAILATEDQRFFEHSGIDPLGLLRATFELLKTGEKMQGGSTITMQVARNYYLNNQKTFGRKFREILLAIKIDSTFSKDKILELYLNKIYLGNHAYGVAAAAEVYYGKPLNQLSLPQLATLAGLPKAPSTINPIVNPIAAKNRRDHVLERMFKLGYIDQQTYEMAIQAPIATTYHGQRIQVPAPYIVSMITDALVAHYGESAVTSGMQVYTTINSKDQLAANRALRDALVHYDMRHGYRGPSGNLGTYSTKVWPIWQEKLAEIPMIAGLQPAAVIAVYTNSAVATLTNGKTVQLPWQNLQWARKQLPGGGLTAYPSTAGQVLHVGDIIRVVKVSNGTWSLAQIPVVEGAIISLNPQSGAILALDGGFDFNQSNFNRVTQAERQPGSGFKPFIYSAALEKGYTLATVIDDAPIAIYDPSLGGLWRPQNDDHKFHGPTRLRVALSQSMNLVSIRLLQDIGINYAVNFAAKFGFDPTQIPHSLSMALGTAEVTPLQMASGYAAFANGGFRVYPYLIDHIIDQNGKQIYVARPQVACSACVDSPGLPPVAQASRILSPETTYLMTSAMQDVIRNGTGVSALVLKRTDLAGKTGTSQDYHDGWFTGFNGDIVTTAWVGYDNPASLGEYGATTALPMWIEYTGVVLANRPENAMQAPPGVVSMNIDPHTGLLAWQGEPDAITEYFNSNYVPTAVSSPTADQQTEQEQANVQAIVPNPNDADSNLPNTPPPPNPNVPPPVF